MDDLRHISAPELKQQLNAERLGMPFLQFHDADQAQVILTLRDEITRITIGRAPDNDVAIPWDQQVSRVHAEIVRAGGDWVVDDDGLSRNGTWVNGERLQRRRRLSDGDVLRIGATHVRFRRPFRQVPGTTLVDATTPPEARVSPAQRRVLLALCRPLVNGGPVAAPATNQQIADELFLSIDAVKSHLRALFATFGLEDLGPNQKRSALAGQALVSGTITVEDLTAPDMVARGA